jgi:transcription elongation factor/antiterminator RfaH
LDEGVFLWYAVYTQCRHEARVEGALQRSGVEVYLPWITVPGRRRDRRRLITIPLFPGYLFVHTDLDSYRYREILKVPGVVRLLGHKGGPTPVPEQTIHSVKAIAEAPLPCYPWPYLKTGTLVQVLEGPLAGVLGVVQKWKNKRRLIVSVDLFQRSVAVELNGEAVVPWS